MDNKTALKKYKEVTYLIKQYANLHSVLKALQKLPTEGVSTDSSPLVENIQKQLCNIESQYDSFFK